MIRDESAKRPSSTPTSPPATQPAANRRGVSGPVKAFALAAYVALSSILGLGPGIILFLSGRDSPVVAFLNVWRTSLPADAIFVAGSLAVAVVSCRLATRRRFLAVAGGYFLSVLVYTFSFAWIEIQSDFSHYGAIMIVAFEYGQLGLLFTAVAPLIWGLATRIRQPAHRPASRVRDGFHEFEERNPSHEETREWNPGPVGDWRL